MLVVIIETTDTPHLSSSREMMEMGGKGSRRWEADGGLSKATGNATELCRPEPTPYNPRPTSIS